MVRLLSATPAGIGAPLQRNAHMRRNQAAHYVGPFAERHPQEAVVEVLNDIFVVAQRRRQRGLPEPTRSGKRRRDGHWRLAVRAEQQILQPPELLRAFDEIVR